MKHQGDDQMDALLALALKDAETEDPFADLDISSVEFSKAYQRQRKRNISRYKHASGLSSARKIRARVALAIACILAVCLIAVMSISAVRDAVLGAIIEWYDDYISVRFETEAEGKDNMNTEAEEKNTEEPWQAVEKARKPTEIPEGIEEVILSNNKARVLIEYYAEEAWYATYRQTLLDDSNDHVDNEGVIIQYADINGQKAIIFEYTRKQEFVIIWNDGKYSYSIASCGTIDELLLIARSVR